MNRIDSRLVLTFIWIIFFITNIVLIIMLRTNHWLQDDDDDFMKALTVINNTYSPYLGVILLFFWTKRGKDISPFDFSFYLASAMSLLWNILIMALLAELLLGKGDFNKNLDLIKNVGGLFSWVVSGAIGFYFGKSL